MAVEDHVEAAGVGGQRMRVDRVVCHVVAQMGHRHNVIGALGTGIVDEILHVVIEDVGAERIDVIALVVLEIGRCGGVEAVGRRHADEGDLAIPVLDDGIGVVHPSVRLQVDQVAAERLGREHAGQFLQARNAEVEFVIAQGHQVVSHGVHDLHDIAALGRCAQAAALDEVAAGNQRDIRRRFQFLVP